MRGVRKDEQARDARRAALGLPEHVRLLPEAPSDALQASAQSYGGDFKGAWKHSRRAIGQESIFAPAAVAAARQHRKRPAGGSSAAAAAAGAGGFGGKPGGSSKQRRLAANVKLRLSEPKKS